MVDFGEIDQSIGRYNEAVAPIMEEREKLVTRHKEVLREFLAEGKELRYKYLLAVDRELQEVKDKMAQLKEYAEGLRAKLRFLKQFPVI